MRRIKLKYVNNFRDLGGYETEDLKEVKFNKIYRSAVPTKLTKEEIKFFQDNNLKTIIDLRNKEEVVTKINFFNNKDYDYYNIPLKGGGFPKSQKAVSDGYMEMLNDLESIKKVFQVIKNSQGSILINCNVGKDRTGVICMLILLLLKVSEEDIIADYEISYTYLKDDIRKMHIENPNMPKYYGTSKMEYMENTLKLFKDKYKNIENYMQLLGFTMEEINLIKNKFL